MKTDKRLLLISLALAILGGLLFVSSARAATFHWIQSSWTDTSANVATHAANRLDWSWFFSATSTGTSTGNFIQIQMYSNGVN